MLFHPPAWLPTISQDLSDLDTIGEFVLRGEPNNIATNQTVLISADDAEYLKTPAQLVEDVDALAAALAHDLCWSSPDSVAEDRNVIGILSENTPDYLTCCWAIHRLGGTVLLLHGSTAPGENAKHLLSSDCKVLISSPTLFQSATATLEAAGRPESRLYLLTPKPCVATNDDGHTDSIKRVPKTTGKLLNLGRTFARLPAPKTKTDVAYLCPTSGTSGIQKLARLTHESVIANILQLAKLERISRHRDVDVVLGVGPFSHVQGMIASHTSIYMRDRFILHSKFDIMQVMGSIQTHRINRLYLVPSVLASLIANPFLFNAFDLSSVDTIYVGAGSLTPELHAKTKEEQPGWNIVTGYGLTESPAAVAMSSPHEYLPGSVGILLSSYQARLIREDGTEVESFDEPGELLLSSPNQAIGYLGDDEGTAATFRNGWLHTGDVALFRKSSRGDAHICIVDRLRDMVKVKGLQVSPVTIEECLRQHPSVADVAVIGVPDDLAGERPKAFIVPVENQDSQPRIDSIDHDALFDQLDDHVEAKLTEPHWIRGKYVLLEVLPRNTSGKVTKGALRARG
ncbi:putative amp dependent CoA ligase [Xylariaceae sp. FL0016]|nr:putative amp dependent CoA ligase [Xylariaceae sp. FL0016]